MSYPQSLVIIDGPKTFFSSNSPGTSLLLREPKESTPTQALVTHPDPVVQKLREGDEETFDALITKYYSSMIRVALQYVPTQAIADEVVQETWLAFLESLERFEGRCSVKTWLFRILSNRAKTRGVQERRYVELPGEMQTIEGSQQFNGKVEALNADEHHHHSQWSMAQTCEHADPEKIFLTKEWVTYIESAIQALPPRQKQIILLRDVEGWTSEEVRDFLNLSEGNQRVLLHRARVSVRNELAPYFQSSGNAQEKSHVTKAKRPILLGKSR